MKIKPKSRFGADEHSQLIVENKQECPCCGHDGFVIYREIECMLVSSITCAECNKDLMKHDQKK